MGFQVFLSNKNYIHTLTSHHEYLLPSWCVLEFMQNGKNILYLKKRKPRSLCVLDMSLICIR